MSVGLDAEHGTYIFKDKKTTIFPFESNAAFEFRCGSVRSQAFSTSDLSGYVTLPPGSRGHTYSMFHNKLDSPKALPLYCLVQLVMEHAVRNRKG